ncbi:hypothetical protein [Yoonia sp.]|uniref:hypothetical protein n=1 Tax=Yoonia sp. TaxID=2212373 RepID=UPI0025EE9DCA|nr:hypothetical protein [Yoonia sp.]
MSGPANRDQIAQYQGGSKHTATTTLIIGNSARWKAEGRLIPRLKGFQFVDIGDLTPQIVNEASPDMVLSPLIGDEFDAVDLAMKLNELNYLGRYRAIANDVPDVELIRREVYGVAPQLDFDLLIMPEQKAG